MSKITIDELNALLADPGTDEATLAPYFQMDEAHSGPFAPRFELNPDTVEIPTGPEGDQRSAAALNLANFWARMRRARRFNEKMSSGYVGPVIVSEGDSWFQYPMRLWDTIDKLGERYAIKSLGAAGDLLENMANKAEYMKALRETGASILLLSGGGNDLVANGGLADYLEEYDPALLPGDYLKPEFQTLLDNAFAQYERMFRQVRGAFPQVHILCHGYDYPLPSSGKWLGKPMEVRNINSRILQKDIAGEMMDRFNRGLRRLVRQMPHVTYIDCRRVVGGGRWYDELHPTDEGYAAVAALFEQEIDRLANLQGGTRGMVMTPVDGPFGPGAAAVPVAAPAVTGQAVHARSLHLGLNVVDPEHYAGWDGRLNACENDARAMAELAAGESYEAEVLLSQAATREAVIERVTEAAGELKEGDYFFWSVSAHGGQVFDLNRDETDDDPAQPKDETLLLYDFQMADDEIYDLWSKFAPGVRILFMPDTCHSGDMLKVSPFSLMAGHGADADVIKTRQMPPDIAAMTFSRNEAAYRDYADSLSAMKENLILNPLTTPIRASVISISACHQKQLANDGTQFGAFTGAVLRTWDKGRFGGDYNAFHHAVTDAIGNPSQTPQIKTLGAADPAFIRQRPFSMWPRDVDDVAAAPAGPSSPVPVSGGAGAPTLSMADLMTGDEGPEDDFLPPDDRGQGGVASRWADQAAFEAFIATLGLRHFSASEFLVLGGGHVTPGHKGFGKNTPPPRPLWPNIANTARVIDELRARIGTPIRITNAYRSSAYNAAVGGKPGSLHMKFNALDFQVPGMSTSDYAAVLRQMRDGDQFFAGGIGLYNTFVHVDTRGTNATWGFRGGAPAVLSRSDRAAAIDAIDLPATRSRMPRVTSAFRSGPPELDGSDTAALEQQKLAAAVSASSVVSFVENLTPQQKEDVLLSTLFAQRAADAMYDPADQMGDWLERYLDVLALLGWSAEARPQMQQNVLKGSASFSDAVLNILAAIATQNQFAILESALEGLKSLGDGSGTIKLFDLSSTVTKGGHFQVGAAEAAGEVVSMALGAFHYVWEDRQKNILFAKWGSSDFDYWMAAQRMTLSPSSYASVRDQIRDKLGDSRKKLIADIPLG